VINRIIFLAHWAILLWLGLSTTMLLVEITQSGIRDIHFSVVLAIFLGPPTAFYLIDYMVNGQVAWLPWQREWLPLQRDDGNQLQFIENLLQFIKEHQLLIGLVILALAIYLGMTYEAEEPAKRYIPLY